VSCILVLTQAQDAPAEIVLDKLRRRGAEVVVFDPAQFPTNAQFVAAVGSDVRGFWSKIKYNGDIIDLERVSAVWVRRPGDPVPDKDIVDPIACSFVKQECKRLTDDVWASMACLWVPGRPAQLDLADFRLRQLQEAQNVGLSTPTSLVTNDPDDLVDFYQKHGGNIISKLSGQTIDYTTFMRYTDRVSLFDVQAARTLRYAPALFQRYVPKKLELRITVVGAQAFAAEIDSQNSQRAYDDWRRYDYDRVLHQPHSLPEEISASCVRLVANFGLAFGAIDMILTPDGRYVFLELNPTGQWHWIEQLTGLPISEALCDLLVSGIPLENRASRAICTV